MNKNIIILYASLLLVPVIINYGLLSWSAPGVSMEANPWLGFLGSFLGLIGAISIALLNNHNQKKSDYEKEMKNNRSFIVLNDFQGPIGLKNVKTHENSRLIRTVGYEELLKIVPKDDYVYTSTSYMKISHYGNSDVILDCNICISSEDNEGSQLPDIVVNTGVLEKQIELFIPIAQPSIGMGNIINLNKVVVEYSTLMNERLEYIMDFGNLKECHYVINDKKEKEILFEFDVKGSKWTYPNKRKD
ncbi:hypothetical protein ACZ11_09680 [Lysinibacillus xylanilyticus]|uniref:Uncharacterized protein n=1 Tax=Lysinibacillus xylanilyticus TaxID=582475 RepID=A0A0K9FCS7_9BACI|nr:hypothetical protein [Lysinibacillus xylanilyticus]KMY32389.1 hypothetical protein ACZ11_09680 [Lysinibacillus xylanilyticus]